MKTKLEDMSSHLRVVKSNFSLMIVSSVQLLNRVYGIHKINRRPLCGAYQKTNHTTAFEKKEKEKPEVRNGIDLIVLQLVIITDKFAIKKSII